ncbi:hypothetical protein [Ensifer aridi]|uniref:hypothetical protein n=1 Tax=Ensifer aridi TaxID=1708715 RepID=UPI0009C17CF7|nr:hypothetical protein [Ensifer aridi]
MALHISELKGTVTSLLAEIGLIEPVRTNASAQPVPPLSPEQQLLVECYRSGQIEHWAWQQHLDEDPVLAAHFRRGSAL